MHSVKNWQWKPKTMYLRIHQLLFDIMRTKRTSCQFASCHPLTRASLVPEMVKNLSAMQEIGVQFLGRKDALEKGMATHSNILAQRIPWTEGPSRLQSMGLQRIQHDLAAEYVHTICHCSWVCTYTPTPNQFYFHKRWTAKCSAWNSILWEISPSLLSFLASWQWSYKAIAIHF